MNVLSSPAIKDQDFMLCEILLYTPFSKAVKW